MGPIFLSVLLGCIPAVTGDSRVLGYAGSFSRPCDQLSSFPATQASFLPHENQYSPPNTASSATCGQHETNCAAQGHQEICCPADTACYPSSHGLSPIFCCSLSFHACTTKLPLFCPLHTFPCPASLAGACCPVGLRCASTLCLEYEYKTQAPFSPSSVSEIRSGETFLYTLPATTIPAYTVIPPGSPVPGANILSCVPSSLNCQPGTPGNSVTDLPISDRVLGTPTAWRAKVGEIAVESRATRGCEYRMNHRRMREGWQNVIWVGVGLLGVTVIMAGL